MNLIATCLSEAMFGQEGRPQHAIAQRAADLVPPIDYIATLAAATLIGHVLTCSFVHSATQIRRGNYHTGPNCTTTACTDAD